MDTRTGMMPVCGALLLCILAILSIRAWQGADLAAEFRGLSTSLSIENIDTELAELRNRVRSKFGLEPQPIQPSKDLESISTESTFDSHTDYSDDLRYSDYLQSGLEKTKKKQHMMLPSHVRQPKFDDQEFVDQYELESEKVESDNDWLTSWEPSDNPPVPTGSAEASNSQIQFISTPILRVQPGAPKSPAPIHPKRPAFEEQQNDELNATTQNQKKHKAVEETRAKSSWSPPKSLILNLEDLYRNPMTASWAHSTVQILDGLNNLQSLTDPNIHVVINQLDAQLEQLDFLTVQLSTVPVQSANYAQGELATQLRQIRYALEKRLQLWPVVHRLSLQQSQKQGKIDNHHVGQFLMTSKYRLNIDGVQKGWADYLKLEEAASVFNSLNPNSFAKKKAARSVLARLYSPSLNDEQRQYLYTAIDQQTDQVLKISASDDVDLEQFLKRLERLEFANNGSSEFYLNDTYQSLLWSENPHYQELAQTLQTHYRNANFRVSVSEKLLNRMVPQMPATREPYRDRIMGADVVGQNRITNQIHVSLIPDPDQISMKLETYGKVNSRTTATRSGIVVENEGTSRFRIIKRLAFGQQGIFAYRPETTSQVAQRVVGLRSNLDNIPPLGWVARKIAKNKIDEQAPVTKRYAQHQLETKAEQKFNQEIDQTLDELEANLTHNLLHPLIAMDLEPDPVETSTSTDRIVMRYRLAGRDQMAANTPRPRGVKESLLSMQIHESALNNTISRFDLAGRKFTTNELIDYLNDAIGEGFVSPEESQSRKTANLEFAPFDPVRIQFEEQKISIIVNLKSFQIGKGKRWKNLVIKSTYDPQIVSGFDVGLIQSEEGLRIKGKRMNVGDQLAVSYIFELLFPEQFQMAMIPSGIANQLQINNSKTSQFVVSDGWIGMSVDDRQTAPYQQLPLNQAQFQRRTPNRRQR